MFVDTIDYRKSYFHLMRTQGRITVRDCPDRLKINDYDREGPNCRDKRFWCPGRGVKYFANSTKTARKELSRLKRRELAMPPVEPNVYAFEVRFKKNTKVLSMLMATKNPDAFKAEYGVSVSDCMDESSYVPSQEVARKIVNKLAGVMYQYVANSSGHCLAMYWPDRDLETCLGVENVHE